MHRAMMTMDVSRLAATAVGSEGGAPVHQWGSLHQRQRQPNITLEVGGVSRLAATAVGSGSEGGASAHPWGSLHQRPRHPKTRAICVDRDVDAGVADAHCLHGSRQRLDLKVWERLKQQRWQEVRRCPVVRVHVVRVV